MKNFKEYIKEANLNLSGFSEIAKGNDWKTFLDKTDSLVFKYDILYRGGDIENKSFFTDSVSHAFEYGQDADNVNGIIINYNDVLYFQKDVVFNNLRKELSALTKQNLMKIYAPYFKNDKLGDAMWEGEYKKPNLVIKFVYDFIHSDVPYTKISKKKIENDLLIPIMLYYAEKKGKNIISFLGNDYGGTDEFVVNDVSKYMTLKTIWNKYK